MSAYCAKSRAKLHRAEPAHQSGNQWGRALAALLLVIAGAAGAQVPSDSYNYTRASSFTYYGPSDGAKNGLLKSETVEPGNAQLCVVTTYDYDAYGNKISASSANCANASGAALFTARSSSTAYASLPAQSLTVNGTGYSNVTAAAGIFATTATNALGQSETRQYDPRFGSVTRLTGPNQLTTVVQLDDFGRKVKDTLADGTGSTTRYCYLPNLGIDVSSNSANCPTPATGEAPTGAVFFTHNEPLDASGAKMGPFVRVYSDALGRQLRTATESFDGSAQPSSYSGAVIVQDIVYNAAGAQVLQTQPYFRSTGSSTVTGANDVGVSRTEYDVLGRPTTVYVADANGSQASVSFGSGSSTTGYASYPTQRAARQQVSYTGLNTLSTNDKGQTRLEEKNPSGQVVRVTDNTGAQIAYQHDAFGNLLTTKDALQNTVQLTYDIRGRKTQMNDPDAGLWQYRYDALGQLVWQQSPNQRASTVAAAQQTTMVYDRLGRMTSRTEPEFVSTWYHDKNADGSFCMQGPVSTRGTGKLCQTTTSNGITKSYVYDSLGRALNSRTTVSNGPSFASAVAYHATTGRVASQTYPTGLQVGPVYTARGFVERLTLLTPATVNPRPATPGGSAAASQSLSAGALLWQARVVNAWGKAEQQLYGNGVNTQVLLEAATGRTTDLRAGPSNTVLNQHYVWDSLNNLTARSDANGDGNTGAVSETFTYADGLNRLTGYTVAAPAIPNLARSVSLQYNALGMLLYKSDVGNYAYGAQGAGASRPHALQSVSGAVNSSNTFDANGNLISASGNAKYSSVAYTSFNMPDSQNGLAGFSQGGSRYTWQYDENHKRIKEVRTIGSGSFAGTRTTWNLHPDNQGGLGFESEVNTPASANALNVNGTSNRHYLSVGGQAVGVMVTSGALPALANGQTAPTAISSITVVKLEFWHRDHLGSLITTTDHGGSVTQRYAYDPFGKRRYTNGSYDGFGNVVIDWSSGVNHGTERGYTGHQQLDEVGLVHMNGRIFDPTLGTFLQSDPLIQNPTDLQNYNRYGYCGNGPMGCTDPSGYFFKWIAKKWREEIWRSPYGRTAIAVVVSVVTYGYGSAWASTWLASTQTAATVGYSAATINAVAAVGGGAVAGFSSSLVVSGGDVGSALKGGIVGGLTAGAFSAVGSNFAAGTFGSYAGHAGVGCASSIAQGGECETGAVSQIFSKYATVQWNASVTTAAVVGGTTSALGGGKFSNGALTGAFGYLFNQATHGARAGAATAAGGAAAAGPSVGERIALAVDQSAAHVGDVLDYIFKSDSVVLARNMVQDTDLQREPGQHAHHIVAANDPRAAPGRAVLDAVKMDVNSAFNGIFLDPSQHARIHTNVYYNAVNAGLAGATTYGDVALRLTGMRAAIQSGVFPR